MVLCSSLSLCSPGVVLKDVDGVMKEPRPDNPLEPEIANLYKSNKAEFQKTAKEWTKKHAK
jgi:ubiquitin-conjugating enzyme E2 D/E